MNLVLIGYRGSGKSTVGRFLAKRLSCPFVDLDSVIAQTAGYDIGEIFARESEAGFRRRETEALLALRGIKHHVIALGGGALHSIENRDATRRLGRVAWLRATPAVLWARICQDASTPRNRPNLTSGGGLAEVEVLLAQREPHYEEITDHVFDTTRASAQEVAETIEMWYRAGDTHGDQE